MQEFKINTLLSLKLIKGKTVIYINGNQFKQCKALLIEIPVDNPVIFDDAETIDDISEKRELKNYNDTNKRIIPPQVEFWGHCSNLQVWYENGYDTRLLHSSLSFPLLKVLSESGDLLASRKFKEEIAKRLSNGYNSTVEFLNEEGYFKYLTREEFWSNFGEDGVAMNIIEKKIEQFKKVYSSDKLYLEKKEENEKEWFKLSERNFVDYGPLTFTFGNNSVKGIGIWGDFSDLGPEISKNSILKMKNIPEAIGTLKRLEKLILLDLGLNKLPNSTINLQNLIELDLSGNNLMSFPDQILSLKNLEILRLSYTPLRNMPDITKYLPNLKILDLSGTNFEEKSFYEYRK